MKTGLLILCITLLSSILSAQEEVRMKDGRTIIIKDHLQTEWVETGH